MFAVIECGGKQHTVSEGESLKVELLSAEEGSTIEFDKVLNAKVKVDMYLHDIIENTA